MRVRYGKPIKVKSLLGSQNVSTILSPTASWQAFGYKNNGGFSLGGGATEKYLNIDNTHKYFIYDYFDSANITTSAFTLYSYSPDAESSKEKTYGTAQYYGSDFACGVFSGIQHSGRENLSFRVSSNINIDLTIKYSIIIDLTEIGLDNLTAQQFYNKYNKYFSLIATGEEITIDDKAGQIAYKNLEEDSIRCKVAGGSSDIYYGYNQLFNCVKTLNGGGTITFNNDGIYTYTFGSNVSSNAYTNVVVDETTSLTIGHKYLLRRYINASHNGGFYCRYQGHSQQVSVTANTWVNDEIILEATNSGSVSSYIGPANPSQQGYQEGDSYQVRHQIIDLTDWFGAGKEPSTVAEFKEKFTKDYYGFCPTSIKLTRYQIEALPSYGYNQLVPTTGTSSTINGITFTNNGDGSYTISGTATANTLKGIMGGLQLQANHTYLYFGAYGGSSSTCYLIDAWSGSISDIGNGRIKTYTSNTTFQSAIYVINGTTVNNLVFKPQFIDLTDWYGAGSEPTTVEEFKATFPNLYYPYSKKRLLNKYMINKLEN